MKRVLITGGEGFVAPYLKTELEAHGYQVVMSSRVDLSAMGMIKMDVLDYEEVRSVLNFVKPDYIFHLAGIAYVPSSYQDPELTLLVNTMGALHIFDAVKSLGLTPTIQIACSSEEYGEVHEDEIPIKETNPLRPLSPYGVSKVAMDLLGYYYYKSSGMKIIRTRAFNHEGPRRGEKYVTSEFAKQIAEIENGEKEPVIKVGNLESIRDFTDVRDTVRAYRIAVEKGKPGEIYNIGSGKGMKMKEMLDKLLSFSTKKDIKIEQDPAKMRPSDVPILVCDATKMQALGWKPEIDFNKTLENILNYWRKVTNAQNRKKQEKQPSTAQGSN